MNGIPKLVSFVFAGLLCAALLPLTYGYYTLLRILATLFFAFAAMTAYKHSNVLLTWLLPVFAIIYNPIIPIHLPKIVWILINVASIIIVLASAKILAKKKS